jgi:hypothetical protein
MDELPALLKNQDGGDEPYAGLVRLLGAVTDDHAQLRMLVYEFARRKLRRNLHRQFEDGEWTNIQQQIQALESAINKVEENFAQNALRFDPQPPLNFNPLVPESGQPRGEESTSKSRAVSLERTLRSEQDKTIANTSESHVNLFDGRVAQRSRSAFWWYTQLAVAVALGIGIFALVDTPFWPSGFKLPRAANSSAPSTAQESGSSLVANTHFASPSPPNVSKPSIPLPTDYGVFAVAQGKLTELELMQMRVPDKRVAISPVISTPSRVHLPEGKLEFVVFRRDLANITPDRAMLRVIAQVVRALTFDAGGRPTTANLSDVWVVRSNAYQVRMAPVADNPEMLLIRSDPADLVLPSGRYALVLRGAGYDFTVDGSGTDAAHCLERTDALVAPIYTECRIP